MSDLTSIDDLLEQMVALGASDLHIPVASPPAFRIRGHIHRAEGFEPFDSDMTRGLLYRILSSEQQKNFELKRQLDFAYAIPGLARFRVNVYHQRETVGAAFRLIPQDIKSLEELNLPQILHRLPQDTRGLRLRTGSRSIRAGSCSSPARPAPVSRRPSPRSSTRSTATAPSTSSPSRIRSSSCTSTSGASSTSARSAPTHRRSVKR